MCRRLLSVVLKQVLALLAIELVIRAVAGLGLVALPPSSVAGFDQSQQGVNAPVEKRLYQPDRDLILRMRPNFHFVYNRTAAYPGKKGDYIVDTEAHGFRTAPFSETKRPGVFRIICLGDSSTFGMNVEAADTYPQVLAQLLQEAYPGRFEVLNFGTPGYSSRQGIELLRREAVRYQPDLVTFGFGSNDRGWHRPLSDDSLIRMSQTVTGGIIFRLRRILDYSYTYRLMKRALASLMQGTGDANRLNSGPPRVSVDELRDNIVNAHALLAQMGVPLVVLNNDFSETDARPGIDAGVQQSGDAYVDMQTAFIRLRRERTQIIEAMLKLPPAGVPAGLQLFRVQTLGSDPVILDWTRYLQNGERVTMHDDGRDGDQRAGDNVWSQTVPILPGAKFIYKYRAKTVNGIQPEFRDNMPAATSRQQFPSNSGVGEIDRFGEVYLHSDGAHPDEEGHMIIAKALFAQLLQMDAVKKFLQHPDAAR